MGRAQRNPSACIGTMGFAALYPSYALPILRIRCPGSRMFDFSPADLTAIALSLKVATVAALASLPLGTAPGWLLARKHFFGKAMVDALVHLPLVLPPVDRTSTRLTSSHSCASRMPPSPRKQQAYT